MFSFSQMSKAQVFLGDDDNVKIDELSRKIIKDLDGYTFNQIETCFYNIRNQIKSSLVINCSCLIDLKDEIL